MKAPIYIAGILLLFVTIHAAALAQEVGSAGPEKGSKQAEKTARQKTTDQKNANAKQQAESKKPADEGTKEGTESIWTEQEVKDFLKVGLKISWKHIGPERDSHDKLQKETLTYKVTESDDDGVTCSQDVDDGQKADNGFAITSEFDADWAEARKGIFEEPVKFGLKLESKESKIRIGRKTYKCTVFSYPIPDSGKYRWWVSKDLPGVILRYENLTRSEEKGVAKDACILESYEVTDLDIPRESIRPGKKAHKRKK